jgi:hypothetical protein
MPALHRNRELWSTFAAVCGSVGNSLPMSGLEHYFHLVVGSTASPAR